MEKRRKSWSTRHHSLQLFYNPFSHIKKKRRILFLIFKKVVEFPSFLRLCL
jgi:hypothetical protein